MRSVISHLSGKPVRSALRRGLLWFALLLGGGTQLLLPMTATAMALAQARAAAGICSLADSGDATAALHADPVGHCGVCALAGGGGLPSAAGPGVFDARADAQAFGAVCGLPAASPAWLHPVSHAPPFAR
jgi:hypothetical protein